MSISLLSEYLETYEGRDKFLRTLCYMAKFATLGTTTTEVEQKFKIFSRQISECRVILRLLDDISAINNALTYKYGKEESDWLIRWTELIQIVMNVVYCPVEHISWAGEHKLIKVNTEAWDNVSTWLWIISLHLSLLKSLRTLRKINIYKTHLRETHSDGSLTLEAVNRQKWTQLLFSTRVTLDIIYAINYLPPGRFWGGKLKTWHVGALGTVSSLIGLYQALSKRAGLTKFL